MLSIPPSFVVVVVSAVVDAVVFFNNTIYVETIFILFLT